LNMDDKLRKLVKESFSQIGVDSEFNETIKANMIREYGSSKNHWWSKATRKFHEFLETEYEISLVPAVTVLLVFAVSANIYLYAFIGNVTTTDRDVYYVQEMTVSSGSSTKIVYVPVSKEER